MDTEWLDRRIREVVEFSRYRQALITETPCDSDFVVAVFKVRTTVKGWRWLQRQFGVWDGKGVEAGKYVARREAEIGREWWERTRVQDWLPALPGSYRGSGLSAWIR